MDTFDLVTDELRSLGSAFVAALPRLALALAVLAGFYVLARVLRRAARRLSMHRGRHSAVGLVLGRLAQFAIVVLGVLVAATIVFPSFRMGDMVEVLGLTSVALGFAFRDILQNFLACILILWTRPFVIDDQIVYKEFEGTVTDIQTRATFIETYDGRRIVIPNAELFTNAVTVNTANARRRMEHDIGIGVGDDIERARAIVLAALRRIDGVEASPAPDVCVVDLADSSVKLRVRWWIEPPRRADVVAARDRVLTHLKARLLEEGIDLPFPTTQVLFHDQTESTDGDRRRQREGWPAGRAEPPPPRRNTAEPSSTGRAR
jgi:small-conductance mechanosensitive channel